MAKRAGPKPGGKIWFIGGPLDNRLEVIRPWHKTFTVAMPLGLPIGCCFGDEGLPDEPAFESFYRLTRLVSRPDDPASIFDCYVHESLTHDQLAARVYIAFPAESQFVLHDFEIDKRLGALTSPAKTNKAREQWI